MVFALTFIVHMVILSMAIDSLLRISRFIYNLEIDTSSLSSSLMEFQAFQVFTNEPLVKAQMA